MSYSFQDSIKYPIELDVLPIVQETLGKLTWDYSKTSQYSFEAKIIPYWPQNGQKVFINILLPDTIEIKSHLILFTLVDYGRNKRNVELFKTEFFQLLNSKKREAEIRKSKEINVDLFVDQLKKVYRLNTSALITDEEYFNNKRTLILELKGKTLLINKEDFLISLIELKSLNILSVEDIENIKKQIG